MKFRLLIGVAVVIMIAINAFGQTHYCKQRSLRSLRPLPKLNYGCPANLSDYDDELLKLPTRISALAKYRTRLESFSTDAWWSTSVEDLMYCDIHKKAGRLTKEEIEQLRISEYTRQIFGNEQIRMISVPDPCYKAGFGGTDIFILNRANGRVHATLVIDGFSSRASDPIDINFATFGGQRIIEIASSTGGLYPMVMNWYYMIDRRSGRAKAATLFKIDGKLTNSLISMMLLGDAEDYGLPSGTEPLAIIKNGRLAKSFTILDDKGEKSETTGRSVFSRTVLKWNGKYFE